MRPHWQLGELGGEGVVLTVCVVVQSWVAMGTTRLRRARERVAVRLRNGECFMLRRKEREGRVNDSWGWVAYRDLL